MKLFKVLAAKHTVAFSKEFYIQVPNEKITHMNSVRDLVSDYVKKSYGYSKEELTLLKIELLSAIII